MTDGRTDPPAPRVTTIIPCFNSEGTVREALDSALEQTLPGVEVVAIDDGSTDRTLEILHSYADRFPERVRVLEQRHTGPYVARNRGARCARGAYLAFLDSDDVWEPWKLEKQIALMDARHEVVLSHTGGVVVGPDGSPRGTYLPHSDYQGDCFEALLVCNRISTSSVVVRADVFAELDGFDEAFPARGDWELWTRFARHGEVGAVREPLLRYREHDGRMSLDTDRMRRYHLKVIEKHRRLHRATLREAPHVVRGSLFAAYARYAADYLAAGRRSRARRDALRAIWYNPRAAKGWRLLCHGILGPQVVDALRGLRRGVGLARS